jgi:Zn-dependent peptidase ImmA (M78 family)/DNA-binding XRE family transcriptional regulator
MTQDDVATHLGVSRSTVAQIEANNRSVSSLELDRLAYLFGRDLREFLADGFEEQDSLVALFRAKPDVAGQPEVMEKLRECIALGRELTNLERILGVDRDQGTTASYPMPAPKNRWEAVLQGERMAEEERRRLGLGTGPAPSMAELIEAQGVRTGMVDLPDDVSGLTINDQRIGLFVVANRKHARVRRRFSFAHEYAHVVADRGLFGMVSRTSERDDLLEVRANSFAARFLMPEDGVRHFVANLGKGKPSRAYIDVPDGTNGPPLNIEGRSIPGSQDVQPYDVVQLASHFEVSCQTAVYRLRHLRIITDAALELLRQKLDEEGKVEDLSSLLGLPAPNHEGERNQFRHRFLGLALEAYRRDEISGDKLRELAAMVEMTPADVERLVIESLGAEAL